MILFKKNEKHGNDVKITNEIESNNNVILHHLLTIKQDIGEMKSDINKTKESIKTLFNILSKKRSKK